MLGGVLLIGLLELFTHGYKPTETAPPPPPVIPPTPPPIDTTPFGGGGGTNKGGAGGRTGLDTTPGYTPSYAPPFEIPEVLKPAVGIISQGVDIMTHGAYSNLLGEGSLAGWGLNIGQELATQYIIPAIQSIPEFPIAPSVLQDFSIVPEATQKMLSGYMAAYGVYR